MAVSKRVGIIIIATTWRHRLTVFCRPPAWVRRFCATTPPARGVLWAGRIPGRPCRRTPGSRLWAAPGSPVSNLQQHGRADGMNEQGRLDVSGLPHPPPIGGGRDGGVRGGGGEQKKNESDENNNRNGVRRKRRFRRTCGERLMRKKQVQTVNTRGGAPRVVRSACPPPTLPLHSQGTRRGSSVVYGPIKV